MEFSTLVDQDPSNGASTEADIPGQENMDLKTNRSTILKKVILVASVGVGIALLVSVIVAVSVYTSNDPDQRRVTNASDTNMTRSAGLGNVPCTSDPIYLQTIRSKIANKNKLLCGLTILDKELFVMSMNANFAGHNSAFMKSAEHNGTSSEHNSTLSESQSFPVATANYAKAAMFWTIFVVGVTGNLLVIAVGVIGHRKDKKGQTLVTRMFICCLAVSDLGLMLTATWSNAMLAITPSWAYGQFFCKFSNLWTSIAAKSSVTMMSIVDVDRYLGLSQPGMMSFFSTRTAALLITIVWVVVISVCIPMFLWFDVVRYSPTFQRCTMTGVSSLSMYIYTITGQVLLFYVPLIVTLASYFGIWFKMYFASRKVTPSGVQSQNNTASRKVARMCTVIVAVFVICWTPFQVNLVYLGSGSNRAEAIALISPLSILSNLNSCINPIVYGFMWKPMRATLKQIFCNSIFGRWAHLKTSKIQTSSITSISQVSSTDN